MKSVEKTYKSVDNSQRANLMSGLYSNAQFLGKLQTATIVWDKLTSRVIIQDLPDSVFQAMTIDSEKIDLESVIEIIANHAEDTEYLKKFIEVCQIAKDFYISIPDAITRYNKSQTLENREITNETRLADFKNQIENNKSVHLFIISGETGSGKTTWCCEQYPDAPVMACTPDMTAFDLMYQPNPENPLAPMKSDFFKVLCGEHKSNIIILDEGNMLSYPCISFLQQIADGVKKSLTFMGQTFPINPDFKIIMTMNPDSDTDSRTLLGDALLSRSYGIIYNLTVQEKAKRFGVPERFIELLSEVYAFARQADMVSIRALDARLIREYWNTSSIISSLEFHLTGQKKEDNDIFWNNFMQNDSVIEKIEELQSLKGETAKTGGFSI